MATASPAALCRRSPARVLARILATVVVLLAIVVAAGAVWFYRQAVRSLPEVDGRISLPGLSAPVTVLRDAQGVPHIQAQNLHDLFEAEGYVTAQDRLWQLDMGRRFGAGELSEILGPAFLEVDRKHRYLQFRHTAEELLADLSPTERGQAEAYVAGVNAYIAQRTDDLPIEFRILRYRPRPWTLADTYILALNMAEGLSARFDAQVTKEKILSGLGAELTADLYPQTSWRDRVPGEDRVSFDERPKDSDDEDDDDENPARDSNVSQLPPTDREALRELVAGELAPGSNEWAVSGAHTVSGRPLLSNDMHLGHTMPNIWYEVHLTAGDFDVAGVALPGDPWVVVGHNQRIGWGFTVLPADVHDLFIETFNSSGQYQAADGWKQPEHRREVLHVKGRTDEIVDVLVTRHGPIVTPLIPGEKRPLALQWTVYGKAAMRFPFYELDSARNWEEFRAALSQLAVPVLNVVYADVDGHIGYQAVGHIPVRRAGDGSTPEPGNDGSHDWDGYIPFAALPSVYDPASGILATANNRTTPAGYKYFITDNWFAPYRAERIYRVLGSGRKFSGADMLELQNDIYSDFDRFCAERLVYAVDHAQNASPRAHQAAELMRGWDGRMTMDSAAAAIELLSRIELRRLLLGPKLGDLVADRNNPTKVPDMDAVAIENILLKQPKRWLPAKYASYDELLAAVVDTVVSDRSAPKNLSKWRYGKLFPLSLSHPIFGRIPLLRHWAGPGVAPQSGGSYTVKQVGPAFGPSERMTVDFADLDRSTLNLVTGESGQIFSRHFMDQWSAWYEGRSFPLAFSPQAVERAARHRLTLEPGR